MDLDLEALVSRNISYQQNQFLSLRDMSSDGCMKGRMEGQTDKWTQRGQTIRSLKFFRGA
jgi:hypothetical protein